MNDFFCKTQNLAIGYGKAPLAEAIALGVGQYIKKPYMIAKLGQAIREELARPRTAD